MFRVTIRDILWLTAVVAVGLAGALAYLRAQLEIRQLNTIHDAQERTISSLIESVQLLMKDPGGEEGAPPDFQAAPAEPAQ